MQKLIYVASPYRGDYLFNIHMTKEACFHVMEQGHLFFAPHLFYPVMFNDESPTQREQAMKLARQMMLKCDELWCFGSKISEGMELEIAFAKEHGVPISYKKFPEYIPKKKPQQGMQLC